ncbi:mediator of RNA polymerase II transcription subunit 26 [Bombina bombina]|uniref:mediator of RNA polymerase II transcription subunit 26 n=1 Tax=Bombina bombina TaxID=8345 RepID=UPI00235A93C5|nr:mediator of RNA polymerase II transcription subunit 26 [Bombina bombina]
MPDWPTNFNCYRPVYQVPDAVILCNPGIFLALRVALGGTSTPQRAYSFLLACLHPGSPRCSSHTAAPQNTCAPHRLPVTAAWVSALYKFAAWKASGVVVLQVSHHSTDTGYKKGTLITGPSLAEDEATGNWTVLLRYKLGLCLNCVFFLQETRLGKLINDVRKKTSNEDLAKRAKKLLRSWQKLIEPVSQNEPSTRGTPNPPGSANGGGAHNCKTDPVAAALLSGKAIQELKNRNDIQRALSPNVEKPANRKRKVEHRDNAQQSFCKVSNPSNEQFQNSPPPVNGIGGSPPESLPSPLDGGSQAPKLEAPENDKHGKIPVNAVRPHTNSPGLVKHPSTSSLLKAAVLKQHGGVLEEVPSHQPRSPRCLSFSPRGMRVELPGRPHTTYAPRSSMPSPSQRQPGVDNAQTPVYLSPTHPSTPPTTVKRLESPGLDVAVSSPLRSTELLSLPDCQHQHPPRTSQHHTPHGPRSVPLSTDSQTPRSGFSPETSKMDSDDGASGSDSRKKKKSWGRGEQDGHLPDGMGKPVRLKERKLTFDVTTGQIKTLIHKDPAQAECSAPSEQHRTETDKQDPKLGLPNPFEQTNWKELSRIEIIQSYLNRQSSLLSSSGVQTQSAHYYMSEYLKQEECTKRESRKTHVLVPLVLPSDLPGRTRKITSNDMDLIHNQHWPGVNGCHDTQGNWYDWTQCISLDPHGDDGRLNILPYVCLD